MVQSSLLSGRLEGHLSSAFCAPRSVKSFFDTRKGDKDFCQTSTEILSLLTFLQVTGRKNSTMYGPTVHLILLLLNYFVEKAQGYEIFIIGPSP